MRIEFHLTEDPLTPLLQLKRMRLPGRMLRRLVVSDDGSTLLVDSGAVELPDRYSERRVITKIMCVTSMGTPAILLIKAKTLPERVLLDHLSVFARVFEVLTATDGECLTVDHVDPTIPLDSACLLRPERRTLMRLRLDDFQLNLDKKIVLLSHQRMRQGVLSPQFFEAALMHVGSAEVFDPFLHEISGVHFGTDNPRLLRSISHVNLWSGRCQLALDYSGRLISEVVDTSAPVQITYCGERWMSIDPVSGMLTMSEMPSDIVPKPLANVLCPQQRLETSWLRPVGQTA